ncbi:FMNH2-dependent alkanesulfonate monooxygenase [Priestia filamentosa]|uniref:FMNH2-dependent alkanesulfonate monooxygenase n=1 Tax=Priestia filamentosa TaxID=1402861 RepID=UPI0002E0BB09|nr:FMNH2-dependent alkanesulfonate monooxygenase [Priestia filamentosa]
MKVFWFIPTSGDGRYLGTSKGGRETSFDYLKQLARAIDTLGYHGALLPTGRSCEDAWVTASSLLSETSRMKFLVALRPGLMSPAVAARMAATFDRFSNGRLLINIVSGGNPSEQIGDALQVKHEERYELTREFLHIWTSLMRDGKSDFSGEHITINGGRLVYPPIQSPYPPIYFGGSSSKALPIAAKFADVYLTWGEPVEHVREKVEKVKALAAEQGRTVKFGIRLHMIVRETADEAWKSANELIQYVDEELIEKARQEMGRHDSEGQRRMLALYSGDRNGLEIRPNLWSGIGLVRAGAGTALVGDAKTVAERMKEYEEAGIDTFILSGYPHLEESYRVAELLFPHLQLEKHEEQAAKAIASPGVMIADDVKPTKN